MTKVINYLIIGLCICISVKIFSKVWEKTHYSYQSVKVTGLAQKDIVSDKIIWFSSFERKAYTLSEANAQIKKDIAEVKQYLLSNGIQEQEIDFSALQINRDYDNVYDKDGALKKQEFIGFTLRQSVSITSQKIANVENAYKNAGSLIDKGVEFVAEQPDYYYTKLSDLKIELLSDATKDGYNRAQKMAENADGSVGKMKSANMGVIQITGQNSPQEQSWEGAFNTKDKNKTASVTVKLEFDIK
ncbi:MAG: SIMPL domain-containing protein [Bacteroidetes bacterium]|nr:SIMPL domain-containing protein [Bacteroidota bacterium]